MVPLEAFLSTYSSFALSLVSFSIYLFLCRSILRLFFYLPIPLSLYPQTLFQSTYSSAALSQTLFLPTYFSAALSLVSFSIYLFLCHSICRLFFYLPIHLSLYPQTLFLSTYSSATLSLDSFFIYLFLFLSIFRFFFFLPISISYILKLVFYLTVPLTLNPSILFFLPVPRQLFSETLFFSILYSCILFYLPFPLSLIHQTFFSPYLFLFSSDPTNWLNFSVLTLQSIDILMQKHITFNLVC